MSRYQLTACVMSHLGRVRQNHEDNFLLNNGEFISEQKQREITNTSSFVTQTDTDKKVKNAIFAVSDGMGGHNAGEVASLITVNNLNLVKDSILSAPSLEGSVERLQEYVGKVNRNINNEANRIPLLQGMGATFAAILFYQDNAVGINVGDSRIYKYNGNDLVQLTKDHTEGQRLLDLKLLTKEEVINFKGRNTLSRYLGMGEEHGLLKGQVTELINVSQRQWFLLCTDGLTDVLRDYDIENLLRRYFCCANIEETVRVLVNTALNGVGERPGGIDNTTVMLVEIKHR